MIKYLILSFMSFTAFAQNVPTCPPESILIEYSSPTTGTKRALCAYQKDGATVKHGEEFIFDTKGELLKRNSYVHGKEGIAPTVGRNLPGTDSLVSQILGPGSEEDKLLSTIHDMMEILTMSKGIGKSSRFKVKACDNQPKEWVKAALLNNSVTKNYSFGEKCDVSGSFVANFISEFPMSFSLRNLDDLTSTSMKVKMSLNKEQKGIRYKFNVTEGSVSSPNRNAQFTAEYQVDINIMTGNTETGTQAGKIHLIKVNDKEVDMTKNIEF